MSNACSCAAQTLMLAIDSETRSLPLAAAAQTAGRTPPLMVELDASASGAPAAGRSRRRSALACAIAAEPAAALSSGYRPIGATCAASDAVQRADGKARRSGRAPAQPGHGADGGWTKPEIVTRSGTGTHAIDGTLTCSPSYSSASPRSSIPATAPCRWGSTATRSTYRCSSSASVISANDADRAIVDAGVQGLRHRFRLAEANARSAAGGDLPLHGRRARRGGELGEAPLVERTGWSCRSRIATRRSICTARFVVVRGDAVIDIWPAAARGHGGRA